MTREELESLLQKLTISEIEIIEEKIQQLKEMKDVYSTE